MEAKGRQVGAYFVPDRHHLYTAQVLTQQLYPKVITTIRELAGGGVIMLPSSIDDFDDPALAAIIDKTAEVAGVQPAGAGEVLQARLGRASAPNSPRATCNTRCSTPALPSSPAATPTAPSTGRRARAWSTS